MTGRVRFYDTPTAWGVIAGDDGRLYMVRGDQMRDPSPREGDRVTFEPMIAEGGPRATSVQRLVPVKRGSVGVR
jgi:cold shock CspA family protein